MNYPSDNWRMRKPIRNETRRLAAWVTFASQGYNRTMRGPKRKRRLPSLDEIDVGVLDFDGCMYPGISKVFLAVDVSRHVTLRPKRMAHLLFVPRLALTALVLLACRLGQKFTRGITDADLVRLYVTLLSSVPTEYFKESARRIPRRLYPGVSEAYAWLSSRWPVGLISLALMEALEAADQYLQNQTGHPLVFKCGNRMDPSWLASDRAVLTGEDKRRYMLQVISQMGSHCPLERIPG